MELHPWLRDEEQAQAEAALDLQRGARRQAGHRGLLSKKQEQRLADVANAQAELPGSATVLFAWTIEDEHATARFIAFDAFQSALWWLSGYIGRTDNGDEVVTHLAIKPERPGQAGVTSDVLRSVSTAELAAKTHAALIATGETQALLDTWGLPDQEQLAEVQEIATAARGMELKRGRAGFPDAYFRGLAFDYLEQAKLGRGALDRLAKMYGRERQTIRDHLHRAKIRDFLRGGAPGTLSYEPSPRLWTG